MFRQVQVQTQIMLTDVFAIVALFYPFENPSPALIHRQLRLVHTADMADQASDHLIPGCDGQFPEDP